MTADESDESEFICYGATRKQTATAEQREQQQVNLKRIMAYAMTLTGPYPPFSEVPHHAERALMWLARYVDQVILPQATELRAELAAVRQDILLIHHPSRVGECIECNGVVWPCDTAKVLGEVES